MASSYQQISIFFLYPQLFLLPLPNENKNLTELYVNIPILSEMCEMTRRKIKLQNKFNRYYGATAGFG